MRDAKRCWLASNVLGQCVTEGNDEWNECAGVPYACSSILHFGRYNTTRCEIRFNISTCLFWRVDFFPKVHQFAEHGERSRGVDFSQSADDGKFFVRHTKLLLIRLSNLRTENRKKMWLCCWSNQSFNRLKKSRPNGRSVNHSKVQSKNSGQLGPL